MELRRAGEALVRSLVAQPSLTSSSPRMVRPPVAILARLPNPTTSTQVRTLTTTARLLQDANNDGNRGGRSDDSPPVPQPSQSSESMPDSLDTSILDFTPKPSSPSPSMSEAPPSTPPRRRPSIEDILHGVQTRRPYKPVSRGLDPLKPELWGVDGPKLKPKPVTLKRLPFKLGASVGRSVHVNERIDLARAFQMMEITCGRNKVKLDARRQRFHERPGLKRKRLKSQRWRARFKQGFKGVIQRVRVMKRQGY